MHSSLVRIYIHRNKEHLNKESESKWVCFFLPREGLDPVLTKTLYEWLKANGFMSSYVQQPHSVLTQQRTIQLIKCCTVTLLSSASLRTLAKNPGKKVSFLKPEKPPCPQLTSEKVPIVQDIQKKTRNLNGPDISKGKHTERENPSHPLKPLHVS